jgi:hypothetical protein
MASKYKEKYSDREWRGLIPLRIGHKFAVRAECLECGSHEAFEFSQSVGPRTASKHVLNKGWRINRMACPDCFKNHGHNKKDLKVTQPNQPKAPDTDIRQQRRDAHALIEMSFDISAGYYKDGYSDEKIADETGISKDWVAKRREEEFGQLKEPSELCSLREELKGSVAAIDAITKRLAALCIKNGWKQ